MGDKAISTETDSRDVQNDEIVKFNPADFLPRRTSRASAQAATQAIKKSVKEEKTDPCKPTVSSDSNKDKTKSKDPGKLTVLGDSSKDKTMATTSTSTTPKVWRKAAVKRKHTTMDCFVKLVRCEEDPYLKGLVNLLMFPHTLTGRRVNSVSTSVTKSVDELDCEVVGEDNFSTSAKQRKMGTVQVNGDPRSYSKYEIVYAPTYHSEQIGQNHISRVDQKKLPNKLAFAPSYGSEKDLKSGVSGSKVRERNEIIAANASSTQKSLSLVVVHPKPGSTIVNTKKGRDSKSTVLHQMMCDPSTVISNNVSRVTASGGDSESNFKCSLCTQTFQFEKELNNHKRLVHNCKNLTCVTCAQEFASQEEKLAHVCPAKFRCEVCGVMCRTQSGLYMHKRMSHSKTLGSYMCYKCCFHAHSQLELDTHLCGGRPLVTPIRGRTAASVMVYPGTGVGSGTKSSTTGSRPNIYVSLAAPTKPTDNPSSEEKKYLCEVCLEMFATESALGSHKCGRPSFTKASAAAPATASGSSQPQPSLPLEVLPEVEQLAKYYTSMVFKE